MEEKEVKVLKLEEVENFKALGGTLKRMFNPETAGTENMTFTVGYFPPDEGLQSHIHPESEEVYYVVRGEGEVYLGMDKKPMSIEPDMAIYIPSGVIHGVKNTGKERLVICFFVAPGKESSVVID
jgi:mannose-6-phosphate isomerase-like protein (cupin superfamily)